MVWVASIGVGPLPEGVLAYEHIRRDRYDEVLRLEVTQAALLPYVRGIDDSLAAATALVRDYFAPGWRAVQIEFTASGRVAIEARWMPDYPVLAGPSGPVTPIAPTVGRMTRPATYAVWIATDMLRPDEGPEDLQAFYGAQACRAWGPGWRVGRVTEREDPADRRIYLRFDPEPDPGWHRIGFGVEPTAGPMRYPNIYQQYDYPRQFDTRVDAVTVTAGPPDYEAERAARDGWYSLDGTTWIAPPAETAEQRAALETARQAADEAYRQRVAERRAANEAAEAERDARHAAAKERAKALLVSLLTPEQRADFARTGSFDVVGSAGGQFRINSGYSFNVYERDRGHWCAAPRGNLPLYDAMAGQLLALRTDEPGFRRIANPDRESMRDPPAAPGLDAVVFEQVLGATVRALGMTLEEAARAFDQLGVAFADGLLDGLLQAAGDLPAAEATTEAEPPTLLEVWAPRSWEPPYVALEESPYRPRFADSCPPIRAPPALLRVLAL